MEMKIDPISGFDYPDVDTWRRVERERYLNGMCPFRSRPKIGQIVAGRVATYGKRDPSNRFYRDDQKQLEECGRVKVAPHLWFRSTNTEGNKITTWSGHVLHLVQRSYKVVEIDPWWDENRPLTEPDYSI